MIRHIWTYFLTAAACSACFVGPVLAQDDPFGADPFGSLSTEPEATAPATAAAEAAPAVPRDDESDPAVLAIRDSDPQTPRELTKAVQLLLDLRRVDEARKYLDQLAASLPDTDTLEALHQEFGSVFFLRLIGREDVQPAGAQLGDAVLDAASAAVNDPARLAALIDRLQNPSAAARRTAIHDLKQAGSVAAGALIGALAEPATSEQVPLLQLALRELGAAAIDPMVAALDSDDAQLRAPLIPVLAEQRADAALPLLLAPALREDTPAAVQEAARSALQAWLGGLPSLPEAAGFLRRRTLAKLRDEQSDYREVDETELIWQWDATAGQVQSSAVAPELAMLHRATVLARQLFRLTPADPFARRLYFAAALQSAQRANGMDEPLPSSEPVIQSLRETDTAELEDILAFALEEHLNAAAVASLRLLGERGDMTLLDSHHGRLSVIAQALKHPDRRVQFAATMAVIELDPRAAFAGSSYLVENLAYFVRTAGARSVLVAHPRTDHAQTLIGMLTEVGMDGESAATGRQAVLRARLQPDFDFVLLSAMLDGPPIAEVLQQLRRDPRTAQIPIGIMARQDRFQDMQQLTEMDPLSETFPRPHSVEGLSLMARRLLARGGVQRVPHDVRIAQARRALQALGQLAEQPRRYAFYDLLRHQEAIEKALLHPRLQTEAARVLGLFGTPQAQQILVNIASQNTRPLPQRQAAAAAFTQAIHRRGLLLTRDEVLLQYDRYNQSESLDRETQKVLGQVLDAIEFPSQKAAAPDPTSTSAVES